MYRFSFSRGGGEEIGLKLWGRIYRYLGFCNNFFGQEFSDPNLQYRKYLTLALSTPQEHTQSRRWRQLHRGEIRWFTFTRASLWVGGPPHVDLYMQQHTSPTWTKPNQFKNSAPNKLVEWTPPSQANLFGHSRFSQPEYKLPIRSLFHSSMCGRTHSTTYILYEAASNEWMMFQEPLHS